MRILTTKTHGVLDYLMGLVLLFSPVIFHLPSGSVPAIVLQIVGGIMIVASLITNYELGLFKTLPMKMHLVADVLLGLFVALSPWLFGFADEMIMPHVLLGVLEIGAGLITETSPRSSARRSEPHPGTSAH